MSKLPPEKQEEIKKNVTQNIVRPKEKASRRVFRDSMILAALLIIITFAGYSILGLQRQIESLEDKFQSKNEIPDIATLEEKVRKLEIALASKPLNIDNAEIEKLIIDKMAVIEKKVEARATNQENPKDSLYGVFIFTSILKNKLWQGEGLAEILAKLKKLLSENQLLQGQLQNHFDLLQTLISQGHKASEIHNIPSDQAEIEEKNLPSYLSWLQSFIKISFSTQNQVPGIADHIRQLVAKGSIEEAVNLVVKHVESYPSQQDKWQSWLNSAQMVQNASRLMDGIEHAVLEKVGE